MEQHIVIAVDGPAAAGKTTTSRALSDRFSLSYLESGRAYRTLAHEALSTGINPEDSQAMIGLITGILQRSRSNALFDPARINNSELRTTAVSKAVSAVAKIPDLRKAITSLMHNWAQSRTASIIEGRDIGTVVFPDARIKFFLTARADERAARRHRQEIGSDYQEVLADVVRRDHEDTSRAASPLRPATDSVVIDTTDLSLDQVINTMSTVCRIAGLTEIRHIA
ncbi:(d)CMP kinase [Actinokineospora terrae]|uniref:Cytidylate kinase n=1 Tax=Actinokineospora terrae TaxID=155974 RepID=A0A1H9RVK3_9PSEU|nr:(d)CMP kinase [Actinokineospora terrae]SER76455.1 cytidylate kinase [Actinokineospora terrae]